MQLQPSNIVMLGVFCIPNKWLFEICLDFTQHSE